MSDKVSLLDLSVAELEAMFIDMGEKKFRGGQVFRWLNRGAKEIDEMTDISKSLREKLKDVAVINSLKIIKKYVSKIDGTAKYLFELYDGNVIESVLMEYKHGLTACISSQVGCRMGCRFCASTGTGFIRNLAPGEMLDQIIRIQDNTGQRIGNVVVMGIGEPLDNYDNLIKFLRLLNSPDGLNIGYRHMTISSCGLVPGVMRLSGENIPVNLSISLHASNDIIRKKLMPIGKRYSIDKIIEACKIYTEVTKRRITFEYALIDGMNDSKENAKELSQKIKGILCHVNLIPVNPVAGTVFRQSSRKTVEDFKNTLEKYGIETTIRRELGSDIKAACGQLRRSSIGN